MKPEPLKDKMFLDTPEDYKIFSYDDIKSAVEWLKKEVWDSIKIKDCIELINEAFEDVVKNEEKK